MFYYQRRKGKKQTQLLNPKEKETQKWKIKKSKPLVSQKDKKAIRHRKQYSNDKSKSLFTSNFYKHVQRQRLTD
jgi:hypothetical protein